MASIQQSMNQLLGAMAGATTAGAYMYRQTAGYQAKQEAKKLEDRAERLQEYSEGIDVEDLGEAYGRSRELQIEAATLDPKKKVASHYDPKVKVSRAERAHQLLKEIAEENSSVRKAEQSALQRQEEEINRQREQKEALAIRTSILRGTPAEHLLYPKEDKK